eukprot:gene7827-16006_t
MPAFWLLSKHYTEINASTPTTLPLRVTYQPLAFWKWTMMIQMEEQWRMQQAMGTGGGEKDSDVLRETLLETNPWLLGLTGVVSVFHMLFDFLFWRKKKSMVGMSVRTMGVNCFIQGVILLYLFDNDTSWMILISNCIGLVIELWKTAKALNIKILVSWNNSTGLLSFLRILSQSGDIDIDRNHDNDNDNDSSNSGNQQLSLSSGTRPGGDEHQHQHDNQDELVDLSLTRKYDSEATSHLLMACTPLVLGFAIYSLLHRAHKSFYSWILGSLVGFVYTFGFVLMTPQLYINFKLKSVAHMPWKAMVYKALNTFIDDLFAFVIKMPTLHRLACFRDDIIFFIYLYQRYAYRVDYSRVNEFGQGGGGGEPAVGHSAIIDEEDSTVQDIPWPQRQNILKYFLLAQKDSPNLHLTWRIMKRLRNVLCISYHEMIYKTVLQTSDRNLYNTTKTLNKSDGRV